MNFITWKCKIFNCFLIVIYILLLVTTACRKDKELKEPLVSVTPNNLFIYANVGEIISFNIKVETNVTLNRFLITSKLDNSFQETVLDSSISLNTLTMLYEFRVPSNAADKSIIFEFTAFDVDGNSGGAVKRVVVYPHTIVPRLLTETIGHQMYSLNSVNPSSYNIEKGIPEYWAYAPKRDRDIQDNSMYKSIHTLSCTWISPSGGQFILYNSFDYANATDSSLISAYETGIKLDKLNNIKQGDIILTKLENVADTTNYAVIKIVSIVDMDSTKNDFYLFNIKK